jgi:phosphoribosyl 1,2-cyclic phosphodiesterase
MSIKIASLNSGSNANCYYVGNNHEAILVDAGLSCRETEKRMKQLSLSMDKVKALFVSHEHSDHITGVPGLSKKYQLPVYITDGTYRNSFIPVEDHLLRSFHHAQKISIGSLSVIPFRKSHDAADPHSFMISGNDVNVGVITDIGYACKRVINYFSQCHAAFLEANYCEDMLEKGSYPYYLKQRIRGDEGHLSNVQALELFQHYKSSALQLLILSHLSKNNNKPELVDKLFAPHAGNTRIVIASRYAASEVFEVKVRKEIEGKVKNKVKIEVKIKNEMGVKVKAKVKKKSDERQLRLF